MTRSFAALALAAFLSATLLPGTSAVGWQRFAANRARHHKGGGPGFLQEQARAAPTPGTGNCTELWFDQRIDHFSWATPPLGKPTYPQRYFFCDSYWKGGSSPIFFYLGNEANVELYVNHTGLMWENAQQFGALVVFAEHRYYGKSQPFGDATMAHLQYLTVEQAMADYATLIFSLRESRNATRAPVIGFGGSYGGMLAAWMRLKYPDAIAGSIAASAPILAFTGNEPAFDTEAYWQVVTRDATAEGGSVPECASNVRGAWPLIFQMGQTADGRRQLHDLFRLCDDWKLDTTDDVWGLAMFLLNAWDTMAMGNYPYPADYLGPMPAYPVRVACQKMVGSPTGTDLLAALRDATAVLNNNTNVACYADPGDFEFDGIWDYQWCTEQLPQETYFTLNGKDDMFWDQPMNWTFIQERCQRKFGVSPTPTWVRVQFGGREALRTASNIVFSNGRLDPWSSGGVKTSDLFDPMTIQVVDIADGAHHVDLFFSNPNDPPSVTAARKAEVDAIRQWIEAYPH